MTKKCARLIKFRRNKVMRIKCQAQMRYQQNYLNFLKKLMVVDNEDVAALDTNLYWLKSELMAETAAVFIWAGAGKSGKPSARLMALHRWARCESSWMGDEVKLFATVDSFSSIALFLLVEFTNADSCLVLYTHHGGLTHQFC